MDFNTQLLRALKTGSVVLGPVMTEKCINEGTARMIVVAGNCPTSIKTKITKNKNQFIHTFEGSGMALGNVCRKPFSVSTLAIINPGESDILSLMRA
ncbi:MAG: 50S ribosomal protein L30e [Methanoregula sp.]|jgi:large subunit ribosomal protein L30e|nr:50S ribosomal protein L30e [Methanoregula sp.]